MVLHSLILLRLCVCLPIRLTYLFSMSQRKVFIFCLHFGLIGFCEPVQSVISSQNKMNQNAYWIDPVLAEKDSPSAFVLCFN